jgi:cytochrome P450
MASIAVSAGSFDPLTDAYLQDPYPLYARLREVTPVFYAESIDMWVVTRADDIDAILRDPERFSARIAQDSVFAHTPGVEAVLTKGGFAAAPTMSNCDPPKHGRIRKQNIKAFSVRRVQVLEGQVRATSAALIDQIARSPHRRADLVAELNHPLPAAMIFRLIGFPDDDTDMLKGWSGDRLVFTWGRPEPEEQLAVAANMVRYWRYCVDFVTRRLADPVDDFTSDLVRVHREDPAAISVDEITNVAYGLSFAGHENLTSMTTNAIRALLAHHDQWELLCADPSLVADAVEECLRYDSSNPGWRRVTNEAVTIGGVDVPAGAKLLLLLGAANHDPAWFERPDGFDITRTGGHPHIAFGKGIHYCLGAALVRLELRIVLEQLTERLPDLSLVPDQAYEYTPNVAFRGPKRLLVEWPA